MGKKFVSILSEQSGRMTALGLLVTMTVTLVLGGVLLSQTSQAASLTQFSDTMDEAEPASVSNHTLQFTVSNAIPAGGSISLVFDSGFNFNSLEFGDVDVASSGGEYAVAAAAAAHTIGVTFDETAQEVRLALGTDMNIETGEVVTIQIGTIATFGATGDAMMTNAGSVNSYFVYATSYNASSTLLDEGTTVIALVNDVTLNAVVAATFRFVVDGMDALSAVDGSVVASASSPTYVGFGTLTAGTPVTMGSSLSAYSNAQYGFKVSVHNDSFMRSSSSADIDCFANGTCSSTGTTWVSPTGTLGNDATYGHMGLHSEDGTATLANVASATVAGNDGDWFGLLADETPVEVWDVSTTADGVTQDIGHIDVGYRIQITALQEYGRYQNRLTYVATPTF